MLSRFISQALVITITWLYLNLIQSVRIRIYEMNSCLYTTINRENNTQLPEAISAGDENVSTCPLYS